jgi:hypothetical protein
MWPDHRNSLMGLFLSLMMIWCVIVNSKQSIFYCFYISSLWILCYLHLVLFHLFRLNSGRASPRCFVYLFLNYMYKISEFMRSQVKWKVTVERSSEKLKFAKPKKWQDSAKWRSKVKWQTPCRWKHMVCLLNVWAH